MEMPKPFISGTSYALTLHPNGWSIQVPDEIGTQTLAETVSLFLRPGDLILLNGQLGGGKTTFCRALIRFLAQNAKLDVPSPTYNLIHTYPLTETLNIVHADFYRIHDAESIEELVFYELIEHAIALVEWPKALISERSVSLIIEFNHAFNHNLYAREMVFSYDSQLSRKLYCFLLLIQKNRTLAMAILPILQNRTVGRCLYAEVEVKHDASKLVLFSFPGYTEPVVRHEKTPSVLEKRSTDLNHYMNVYSFLHKINVPLLEIDLEAVHEGVIVFNLPRGLSMNQAYPQNLSSYEKALDLLIEMVTQKIPRKLALPNYDREAFLFELEGFISDYCPRYLNLRLSPSQRLEFLGLFAELYAHIEEEPKGWSFRNFSTEDLLFAHRHDTLTVYPLNLNDVIFAPVLFDLVALLQDPTMDIEYSDELYLLSYFIHRYRKRTGRIEHFKEFAKVYAIAGLHLSLRRLNQFADYESTEDRVVSIPERRLQKTILKNCQHPALSRVQQWMMKEIPELFIDTIEAQ